MVRSEKITLKHQQQRTDHKINKTTEIGNTNLWRHTFCDNT